MADHRIDLRALFQTAAGVGTGKFSDGLWVLDPSFPRRSLGSTVQK